MGLAWLHISDIHFRGKDEWQAKRPRDKLLSHLRAAFADKSLPRPDLIFCTGDIAFGETDAEALEVQYQTAKEFFGQLLAACGLDQTRLFVVPGNHDINRNEINDDAQETLVKKAADSRKHFAEINQRIASNNKKFQDAAKRLAAYDAFIADYLPHQHVEHRRCHYAQKIKVNGIQVGIAGINSAWSCAGDEDDRNLWIGSEWQLNQAETVLQDADMRIGLMHHPLDWLCEAEREYLEDRILAEFDFWLGGHVHRRWVTPIDTHIVVAAGAVGAAQAEEFGINLVEITKAQVQAKVHLRGFKHDWLPAPVAPKAPNGIWPVDLPQRVQERLTAAQAGTKAECGQAEGSASDDASRIQQTLSRLGKLLGKEQLSGFKDLEFDSASGIPQGNATALQQENKTRVEMAEDGLEEILRLARYIKRQIEDGIISPAADAKRKKQLHTVLVNAAQQMILLGAKRRILPSPVVARTDFPVMNGISVALLTRDDIAGHLKAEYPVGDAVRLHDPHQMRDLQVEVGTYDGNFDTGAVAEILKSAYKLLYPQAEVPLKLSDEWHAKIRAELKRRKKDGKQVLLTISLDKRCQYITDDVIAALPALHIGVIQILGLGGDDAVFEFEEGEWQNTLANIYAELRGFAPDTEHTGTNPA